MQHAQRHAHAVRRQLRRNTLPALLLSLAAGAFAGLAAESASAAPARVVQPASAEAAPRLDSFDLQRASRSRRVSVFPSPSPSPVVAPPSPKPSPKVTAKKPSPAATRISGACPVPAASFTDTFGDPRSGGRSHEGTDLMAPQGSPVYAVADGVVRTASSSAGGISLYLRADDGDVFFYAHNSANIASNGERVEAGELIAKVGSSGNASGGASHVHFEWQPGGGASVSSYRLLRGLCG